MRPFSLLACLCCCLMFCLFPLTSWPATFIQSDPMSSYLLSAAMGRESAAYHFAPSAKEFSATNPRQDLVSRVNASRMQLRQGADTWSVSLR